MSSVVKKTPKMKPNPQFCQILYITFYVKLSQFFLQKNKKGRKKEKNVFLMPKVNNRPTGENPPNLVTLLMYLRETMKCK
jgi:hypothetical protein